MSTDTTRAAMAKAFRETALSLIGLFQIYEVDPDLNEAAAEVLGNGATDPAGGARDDCSEAFEGPGVGHEGDPCSLD